MDPLEVLDLCSSESQGRAAKRARRARAAMESAAAVIDLSAEAGAPGSLPVPLGPPAMTCAKVGRSPVDLTLPEAADSAGTQGLGDGRCAGRKRLWGELHEDTAVSSPGAAAAAGAAAVDAAIPDLRWGHTAARQHRTALHQHRRIDGAAGRAPASPGAGDAEVSSQPLRSVVSNPSLSGWRSRSRGARSGGGGAAAAMPSTSGGGSGSGGSMSAGTAAAAAVRAAQEETDAKLARQLLREEQERVRERERLRMAHIMNLSRSFAGALDAAGLAASAADASQPGGRGGSGRQSGRLRRAAAVADAAGLAGQGAGRHYAASGHARQGYVGRNATVGLPHAAAAALAGGGQGGGWGLMMASALLGLGPWGGHMGGGGGGGAPSLSVVRDAVAGMQRAGLPPHLLFSDRDFTPDDYEMLCRLDEGVESRKGAPAALVEALPTQVVPAGGLLGEGCEQLKCAVCLEEYEEGCCVRSLPCAHRFHSDCIGRWLGQRAACPVCLQELK